MRASPRSPLRLHVEDGKNAFGIESGGQEMSSLPHLFTASGVIRNAEGC